MNPDLWLSNHRNLNRASDLCCSNVPSSIQATIWIHTSSWFTRKMQQPTQGPLPWPFVPYKPLAMLQQQRSCFKVNPIPWFPWPVPQWTPSFLRVKFWFLKFYKPLHNLSPGPLCLISSTPLSLNPLSLSHSGPGCYSNIQALFWKHLLKTSLSQSISLTFASLLYPHLSLSSQHSS